MDKSRFMTTMRMLTTLVLCLLGLAMLPAPLRLAATLQHRTAFCHRTEEPFAGGPSSHLLHKTRTTTHARSGIAGTHAFRRRPRSPGTGAHHDAGEAEGNARNCSRPCQRSVDELTMPVRCPWPKYKLSFVFYSLLVFRSVFHISTICCGATTLIRKIMLR